MQKNQSLIVSICIFIIVGMLSLLIILYKGNIGNFRLVSISAVEEKKEETHTLSMSIDKKYLSSVSKETAEISVLIDNEISNLDDVEITSSNEEIAKIEDGKVVAVSNGKASITAKYKEKEITENVTVITPIKTISFTSTNSVVRVGKDLQMKLQVTPSDGTISTLKYTSSDESIATVNINGIVTGVSAGKVEITVEDEYTGVKKSIKLTISK